MLPPILGRGTLGFPSRSPLRRKNFHSLMGSWHRRVCGVQSPGPAGFPGPRPARWPSVPPALSAWISVSSESPAVLAPDDSSLKSLFPSGLSHVLVLGQLASSPSVCSLMHLCGGACPRAAAGLRLGGGVPDRCAHPWRSPQNLCPRAGSSQDGHVFHRQLILSRDRNFWSSGRRCSRSGRGRDHALPSPRCGSLGLLGPLPSCGAGWGSETSGVRSPAFKGTMPVGLGSSGHQGSPRLGRRALPTEHRLRAVCDKKHPELCFPALFLYS